MEHTPSVSESIHQRWKVQSPIFSFSDSTVVERDIRDEIDDGGEDVYNNDGVAKQNSLEADGQPGDEGAPSIVHKGTRAGPAHAQDMLRDGNVRMIRLRQVAEIHFAGSM